MKIKLTDIPVYYVNLEGEDEKRKHTESMLKILDSNMLQDSMQSDMKQVVLLDVLGLIILFSVQ